MTKKDENEIIEDKVENTSDFEDLKEELEEMEDQEDEELEKEEFIENSEVSKLKEVLARKQADYENFKKRVDRDRSDMTYFLKSDILLKMIPRLDDIERIINNTPEELRSWALYEWLLAMEKKFKQDLEKMWVKSFVSKWEEVDPDRHEVMTQVPWEEGIIVDEFEKWYFLEDRVLRVAKVVVGNWS